MRIRIEEARDALRYIRYMAQKHCELNYDCLMKYVASDKKTPSSVLNAIAGNTSNVELLIRIAANPVSPSKLLHELATHENKEVRLAVADNPNASGLVVAPLVDDESPTVRYVLAENPTTNEFVLEKLTRDDNPFVAHRAEETLFRLNAEPS